MISLRRWASKLPESSLKMITRSLYYSQLKKALRMELMKIPIVESGLDGVDQCPYIVLKNGLTFFGKESTVSQKQVFFEWQPALPPTISVNTIGVAIDVVNRYLYPHAMPHLTMPYARRVRKVAFHPQHSETIDDLPSLPSKEKEALKKIFSPKQGETFLDLGAYMGYGTMRLATTLGENAKVISVEADPDNQQLLKKNIEVNKLTNVTVVPKAIWKSVTTLTFHKSERQANSLVEGIIEARSTISVNTTTVDQIMDDFSLNKVDIISATLNGAEVEAIEGMTKVLTNSKHIRISMAGWYKRDGHKIFQIVEPHLLNFGLNIAIGRDGGVFAWK